jgi:glycogen operon protein
LGYRLTGSSDLYEYSGRMPYASINFVTAHDGFTLLDLVSYNEKHNEANCEGNRDGHDDNLSWNCGVEGPTEDPACNALRARQQRNFLATLILAQGVPMLLAGDEMGRTQQGNNNTYCHDNEIAWLHWQLDRAQRDLFAYTRYLIRLFHRHPVLRRRAFFRGRRTRGSEVGDLTWFRPDGAVMTDEDWANPEARCLGLRLAGDAIAEVDERGNRIKDDTFLLLLNAHYEPLPFVMPAHRSRLQWVLVLDTRSATGQRRHRLLRGGRSYEMEARSLALFRLRGA